jgi:hypothetical protein
MAAVGPPPRAPHGYAGDRPLVPMSGFLTHRLCGSTARDAVGSDRREPVPCGFIMKHGGPPGDLFPKMPPAPPPERRHTGTPGRSRAGWGGAGDTAGAMMAG